MNASVSEGDSYPLAFVRARVWGSHCLYVISISTISCCFIKCTASIPAGEPKNISTDSLCRKMSWMLPLYNSAHAFFLICFFFMGGHGGNRTRVHTILVSSIYMFIDTLGNLHHRPVYYTRFSPGRPESRMGLCSCREGRYQPERAYSEVRALER